jgi:hypothetical protein
VSKMTFRAERIEYVELEVDVPLLVAEWCDKDDPSTCDPTTWDRDDVSDVLHQIGFNDLTYSGDFIEVIDQDTEESIL